MGLRGKYRRHECIAELQKLTDWLIDGGRSAASPSRFMAECCERMVAAGLPLWRVGVFVRTLHPEIYGRNFIWKPGSEVEVGTVDFGILESPDFHTSPLKIVFQQGQEVRARIDDPASKRFPIIEDLRAEGVTDYIALPLPFIGGTMNASSWTTKQPGGFTEEQLAALRGLIEATGAGGRDHQLEPHGGEPARHLCRQQRRRADHGRPDQARAYRDDECRDLAVRSARLYRAVGPRCRPRPSSTF